MRFMMMVKGDADPNATSGAEAYKPTTEQFEEMNAYNDELVKAGVMLGGEGLHPTSQGVRVVVSDPGKKVIDGPFAESKEVIAGFWILQAKSLAEATEWAKRVPNLAPPGVENIVELRQIHEVADLGEEFTPELREKEAAQREQAAANADN
jgi:hypothetical protein